MKEEKKVTMIDRIKVNFMCWVLENYGFMDLIAEYPELQKKFADKLFTFLKD